MGRLTRQELRDATCVVCPAQRFPLGAFDVVDSPQARNRYDPQAGYRRDRDHGYPVCAHPYRVGLPPGAYASEGAPLPDDRADPPAPTSADLVLPEDPADLEAWMVAMVRTAGPDRMDSALQVAESIAVERFPPADVLRAMRRVLSVHLVD